MRILLVTLAALITISIVNAADTDIINAKVERSIDVASHLVHITHKLTVENKATSGSVKSYTFVVEPAKARNVAYLSASLPAEKGERPEDADKRKLNVVQIAQDAKGTSYRVDFRTELAAGKQISFEVELVLFNLLKPYPAEITQAEKQYILYNDNHYYYSPYLTKTQTTSVVLGSDKVESYSQLKPTSKSDSTITYGPYENVKPFEQNELTIHYENNSPFLTISKMTRTIEVSHWGNIAVEETIDMYHAGAKLDGSFSRFEYMRRQGGASSVKSFKTLLPPLAADVYYRDEIGNISTSNLRPAGKGKGRENVELELRPRFPLFGGWKTHYMIGYNVPAYQYLFTKGDNYLLKMKIVDHVFDDQYIENLQVKIILPEHTSNFELITPYIIDRGANEIHHTYLDTVGRPVIVINKKNVVEQHIQDFQLKYKFNKLMILQEPLLVVAFFFLLFTFVIIIVRIDFSLTHKTTEHLKKE